MTAIALAAGRRAGQGVALLLLVLLASFVLARMMPGDPVDIRLMSGGIGLEPGAAAELRARLGLDQPLWSQFLDWIGGLARLDAGRSLASDRPVLAELAARLPWSVAIGLGGLLLGAALGVALGVLAACRRGGVAGAVSRALAVASQAVPAFAVAFLIYWLIAIEWGLVRPIGGGVVERLAGPVLVVALFAIGVFARVTIATLEEVERQPWFLAARARGLSRERALVVHGGPQVQLAALAVLVPELGWAIGGTAVTEIVFGVPGLSAFVVEAAAARDHAIVQVYVAAVVLWMAAATGLAALARRVLDPRPGLPR
jgi:peptide/nickel transport system permease protein